MSCAITFQLCYVDSGPRYLLGCECTGLILRLLPWLFRGTEIPYPAPKLTHLAKIVAQGNGSSFQEGWAATLLHSTVLPAQVSWERRSDRQKGKGLLPVPGQASAHKAPVLEVPVLVFFTLTGNRNIQLNYPAVRG